MRTTVRIEDELYKRVKARAATEGRTVAAVLEDAVRLGMHATEPDSRAPVSLPTVRAGGLRPGIDLSSQSSIQEAIDDAIPLDTIR